MQLLWVLLIKYCCILRILMLLMAILRWLLEETALYAFKKRTLNMKAHCIMIIIRISFWDNVISSNGEFLGDSATLSSQTNS